MDLLSYVPSWDDVERNLEHQYSELNQSVSRGLHSANAGWEGFTRRIGNGVSNAYGAVGGRRIDCVRQAMAMSYPIMHMNLTRKWASINIAEILPVLLKLLQEVVMIIGGSVMVGAAAGGAIGSLAFGAGAVPGAAVGGSIGLQVGNLILAALGLYAITGYFSDNLGPCIETISSGIATAWNAEEGLKHPDLDPSGGSAATIQERTERAARQLARGQEQMIVLLLMAIATYLSRGQIKSGVIGSLDDIATRSAALQRGISNKEFANWIARNEQKILAQPELQLRDSAPLAKVEKDPQPLREQTFKEKQQARDSGTTEKTAIPSGAENVNAQAALRAKLSGLQKAQANAAVTKKLPDGRIRYYTQEVPARTEGMTRGASFATEFNPKSGTTRQWMESYDQSGNIIRIHPKSINGQPVSGQHYPPTGKELESWK